MSDQKSIFKRGLLASTIAGTFAFGAGIAEASPVHLSGNAGDLQVSVSDVVPAGLLKDIIIAGTDDDGNEGNEGNESNDDGGNESNDDDGNESNDDGGNESNDNGGGSSGDSSGGESGESSDGSSGGGSSGGEGGEGSDD